MDEKSIGRGVIVLSLSSIILKLLSALYMPILSQILTDEGIAIYTVGYDIFVFLFALTSLGVQPAITKLVAEQKVKGSKGDAFKVLKVSRRFLFIYGGVVSILFAMLAKPLSILLNSQQSMWVFVFLSPAILGASILSAYRGFFQGYNDMITLSVSNIIEQLLNVTFSLLFAFQLMKFSTSWGSTGGTVGTTIGAIGAIIYIQYVLKKKYSNRGIENNNIKNNGVKKLQSKEILKSLLVSAIPFILIAAIQNISNVIDVMTIRTFIENDINVQTATLKYYTTIINVPLVIVTSLGIGIFPKIIKSYIERNKNELVVQTSYFYKLTYIIIIPSICGLMILSKDIFYFVFNRHFGYEVLLIGAISLLFMSLSTIQNIILQGMNKFKFIITLGISSMVIKTVLNITLISIDRINILGAVIATIVSLMIVTVANHMKLQKCFDIKIPIVKQSKAPITASIIMSLVLLFLKYQVINRFFIENYTRMNTGLVTIVLVIIGGITYSLALLFLGGITKYELDTISPKIYEIMPAKLKEKVAKIR